MGPSYIENLERPVPLKDTLRSCKARGGKPSDGWDASPYRVLALADHWAPIIFQAWKSTSGSLEGHEFCPVELRTLPTCHAREQIGHAIMTMMTTDEADDDDDANTMMITTKRTMQIIIVT